MIYKIYPIALGALCILFGVMGLLASVTAAALTGQNWLLFLWQIPAGLLSWYLASFVVARNPKAAYVNDAEIDGMGLVHAPLDVIMPFWICTFLFAIGFTTLQSVKNRKAVPSAGGVPRATIQNAMDFMKEIYGFTA